MKSSIFTVLVFLLFCTSLSAQGDNISVPDTLQGWQSSWVVNLNGSQAAYSNWSQGGTSNISAAARTIFTTMWKEDRFSYAFRIDSRYGGARLDGEGLRKTQDRLYVTNRFLYDVDKDDSQFKLFSNITFRTQFDKGFDYGGADDGGDRLISRFMAPAFFNQNAGLAYLPTEVFSIEAGLGLQQKVVRDSTLAPVYNLSPGDRFRSEAGFTLGTKFETSIAENVEFSASLDTFTNMKASIRSTDVYVANKITGEINSNLNASFNLELIYDDDFSKEIQLAQVLSLGLSYTLR